MLEDELLLNPSLKSESLLIPSDERKDLIPDVPISEEHTEDSLGQNIPIGILGSTDGSNPNEEAKQEEIKLEIDLRPRYTVERGIKSWIIIDDLTNADLNELFKNCSIYDIAKKVNSNRRAVKQPLFQKKTNIRCHSNRSRNEEY